MQRPPLNSAVEESVLQLAPYLEHLEENIYIGGFKNLIVEQYTAAGFPPRFRENVGVIAEHYPEDAGYTPVPPCTYKLPYTDPKSFVDLDNIITSVDIGAFLGGTSRLTDDPDLLTAARSSLTVKARHNSYLRAGIGASPFPTTFGTALTAPKLAFVSPTPAPNLQAPTPAGTTLKFNFDPSTFLVKVDPNAKLYVSLVNLIINVTFIKTTSCGDGCVTAPVPEGASCAAFAVLNTFKGGLNEK